MSRDRAYRFVSLILHERANNSFLLSPEQTQNEVPVPIIFQEAHEKYSKTLPPEETSDASVTGGGDEDDDEIEIIEVRPPPAKRARTSEVVG